MRWQHLPTIDPQPGSSVDLQGVKAHDQLDFFADWSFAERYMLRAGIDNLTDAEPEVVGQDLDQQRSRQHEHQLRSVGCRFPVGLTIGL